MARTDSERIVLDVPVGLTEEELALLCRVEKGSAAYELVEELLPVGFDSAASRSAGASSHTPV